MKSKERSRGGLALQPAALIRAVHALSCENWPRDRLTGHLRECARIPQREAEAYGLLKEIIRRITGLTLFDAQLYAAHAMLQGRIAELPTGEGKTLAAVVAAAVFALRGRPVHVLVANDYLATRDAQANGPIYAACGLTCGCITAAGDHENRKASYACDVLYGTAKEVGFDCLRDFLCMEPEMLVLPELSVALVDEADCILLDEARIPLVLAGNANSSAMPAEISGAVLALPEAAVGIRPEEHQVWLTDAGVAAMEARLGVDNLFLPENADMLAMVRSALEARFLLRPDRDYIVQDGQVLVVDESTGRVAEGRRFPDLLHQAVELQALGVPGDASAIYHSMTLQAYLLQYTTLCGMTGTAASSAYEFKQMYGLAVDVIPPHCPCIRIDHPDAVFLDKPAQEAAILDCIQACHAKGQPVLAGTQSVGESERLSGLLTARGIPHRVLNAKHHAQEAAIIAQAGRPYQVTISTNMAGRGVDIRLGGADGGTGAFVRAVGGLFVVGTGMHRSLRIDNQLRGRAGRQGDPGESRLFACLADWPPDIPWDQGPYDPKHYPKLLRRAQRLQEGRDVEARYMLLRYADILEGQRRRITAYRMDLLLDRSPPVMLLQSAPRIHRALVGHAGLPGVTRAEKQLTLYFINLHWAAYLEAMEDMRRGIHLVVIANKNPLNEYMLFATAAFAQMQADIQRDVIDKMQRLPITENGIDMQRAGLTGATTTWTYMINESPMQFTRIPQLVKTLSRPIRGTLFTLRDVRTKLTRAVSRLFSRRNAP